VPLYEYECRKCHHRFEEIRKLSDPPVRRCPKCKANRVQKLLSAPAVHFKGTGWYVTDYGKGGSQGASKGQKEDKAGKDKESAAKDSSTKDSSAKESSSKESPASKEGSGKKRSKD
jgi:putative FmdB family regulatory protein